VNITSPRRALLYNFVHAYGQAFGGPSIMRPMQNYVLLVYTRPISGMEADYHRWYNEVHLAEVLRVPGFIRAERLEVCETSLATPGRVGEYLAVYNIESSDIAATMTTFERARMSMSTSPSLDLTSVSFQLLRVLTNN
jgi:hypothetical protein